MDEVKIDQKFYEKLKRIVFLFNNKVPIMMFNYYGDILKGKNIEEYMQMFSLSREELINYARVCKIVEIYNYLNDIVELVEIEEELKEEDIDEYRGYVTSLQSESEEIIKDISFNEEKEEEKESFDQATNLIIYSNYIDESRDNTVNNQSGKGEQTQKNVANLIEQLRNAEYFSLRKKGYIHQNQVMGSNKQCYLDGNAFERVGRGSSKVNYIMIPISQKNREAIKNYYNIDFDTFYLVVSYGDFKNEGYDELKYYNKIYCDFKKNYNELLYIINLFRTDFSQETFNAAIELINNGFKTTESITAIIKNKQNNV